MINLEVTANTPGLCQTGIPLPKGLLSSADHVSIFLNDREIPHFSKPLVRWEDDSIQWLFLGFMHQTSDNACYKIVVSKQPAQPATEHCHITTEENIFRIESGEFSLAINKNDLATTIWKDNNEHPLFHIISLAGHLQPSSTEATVKLNQIHVNNETPAYGAQHHIVELQLAGEFIYPSKKEHNLRFETQLTFIPFLKLVKVSCCLHNPNAAQHPAGCWDLGDPGSELFTSYDLEIEFYNLPAVELRIEDHFAWDSVKETTMLAQHASGGEHWQSPSHLDRDNKVPLLRNGYMLTSGSKEISTGNRATPVVHSSDGMTLTMEHFWQNFPAELTVSETGVSFGLFPKAATGKHELQGGEKKTHTVWINLAGENNCLDWVHHTPIARVDATWLAQCNAYPMFSPINAVSALDQLISYGIHGEHNFFNKRETIDEYGWRNFGDLYADHETRNYQGDDLFISHYNNQYDPIYGFLRQFLLTGKHEWYTLANDLASHVKDIDIYHCELDKAEYNGGLFWHTDHYLKAFTATHRSFSKYQGNDAYHGRTGGGGPGGQHCYTTGLAYHYLMTGNENSKTAVLTLAKWISNVYEGTGTLFELLVAFKKRKSAGLKNHFSNRYPLDRGTGNYLIALLDSFLLTRDRAYLDKSAHIIKNTVHPNDDIDRHNLANVEDTWFYVVFLQAICRFLDTKDGAEEYDEDFFYARDTLLHYANWILENELPYLDRPEILEFPNDTWVAQELRKTHVLIAAYYYADGTAESYINSAKKFLSYATNHLKDSPELSYTRILVLLMQNHGTFEYYSQKHRTSTPRSPVKKWPSANYQQHRPIAVAFVYEFIRRLRKLSISKEIQWISKRI